MSIPNPTNYAVKPVHNGYLAYCPEVNDWKFVETKDKALEILREQLPNRPRNQNLDSVATHEASGTSGVQQ
jgi:hypothetical protein